MRLVFSPRGIYLSFKPLVRAEALLVENGEVVVAGAYEKLIQAPGIEEEIVVEKPLGPGFVDAHLHVDSLGFENITKRLLCDNIQSLLEEIRDQENTIGEWIIPGRVDPARLREGRLPIRKELDTVLSGKPILIIHQSGHMGVLNTKGLRIALKILGENSEIDHEKGYVFETSLWRLMDYIRGMASEKDLERVFQVAYKLLENKGISAIGLAGIRVREFESLIDFYREGNTRVRTYAYLYAEEINSQRNRVKKLFETHLPDRLRLNGLKILIDGALGPRTALLSEDYSDAPGVRGVRNLTPEFLVETLGFAEEHGLQLAMHAIGDAALDQALEVLKRSKNPGLHRIEHASLVRDDQLEWIRRLRPLIIVQPRFILSDKWMLSRVGIQRARWVYRFKTLSRLTTIALSTDAPVEPVDPFETVYSAVTRGLYEGIDYGYDHFVEALTLIEALDAYTRGGSLALKDDRLGCLLPGCYADIVEYSEDPLKVSNVSEIRDLGARLIPL